MSQTHPAVAVLTAQACTLQAALHHDQAAGRLTGKRRTAGIAQLVALIERIDAIKARNR